VHNTAERFLCLRIGGAPKS